MDATGTFTTYAADSNEGQPRPRERSLFVPFRSETWRPGDGRFFSPALKGISVLLIEDTEDLRELFSRFLSNAGAEWVAASGAREARSILKNFEPDVILSDIGLPGEDGCSLLRSIRALEMPDERVPAIAITAYEETESSAKASGFDLFLHKPVDAQTLVESICRLLHLPLPTVH